MKQIEYIPYKQYGEKEKKAVITKVKADFSSFTDNEIQLLGYLSSAADCMNTVFRMQFSEDTAVIIYVLEKIRTFTEEEEKTAIDNYLSILHLQNGPWSLQPRKNHHLLLPEKRLRVLARRAGAETEFDTVKKYFFEELPLPDKAEFYPEDLTDKELENLGDSGKQVNTSIRRNQKGTPEVRVNETKYADSCSEAIRYLRKARGYTENVSFQIYLDAKIEELSFGTKEGRRLADYHWIRHDSPIDIVISTALEEYLDNWKNFKGAAAACVTVKNISAEDLLKKILALVPEMEQTAPWKVRRLEIDPDSLPKLKFVDIVNWTGDYISSPMTVLAQSLPNDEWVGKNVGTVNMVYINTTNALYETGIALLPQEFFAGDAYEALKDQLLDALIIHGTLHEIGHTTGCQDSEHQGEPSRYFESDYSWLEEIRAELFGMWAADFLGEKKVISADMADACQYYMLTSMIRGLRFTPEQAHTSARNIMYHYFLEKGAIVKAVEQGKTVFSLELGKIRPLVSKLLGEIGDIKSSGDKVRAVALREKYCFTDEMFEEVKERTKDFPQGTGLIFPELAKKEEGYSRDFQYPDFVQQRKFQ